MDPAQWEAARAAYVEALQGLREAAADAERTIADEALILLRLHPESKMTHRILGSQFGSRTAVYALHVGERTNGARLQVSLSANDPLTPVAGPDAEPTRMLVLLQDAPALLQHLRHRVEEIRDNVAATGGRPDED